MNAHTPEGLYKSILPPNKPTLMQRALVAIEAKKRQREHLHNSTGGPKNEARHDMLDDHQTDSAEEFFAALEAETGIDRRLFAKLVEIA